MERNTKILLGVGAGVLAYLIYKSAKPKVHTTVQPTGEDPDIPRESISESTGFPVGAYRLKEDIGGVVYTPEGGGSMLYYDFKAGELVEARPMEVRRGAEKIVVLKTRLDKKMPCEGFSCMGEIWITIPVEKAEFSGRAMRQGGSSTSSSEPKSQADCPPGTTFSYQPTGEAKCPPGTPRELGCSPRKEYKPMCVKNIEPGESILKGVLNSFDGGSGVWDTPINNYGGGSLGLEGIVF